MVIKNPEEWRRNQKTSCYNSGNPQHTCTLTEHVVLVSNSYSTTRRCTKERIRGLQHFEIKWDLCAVWFYSYARQYPQPEREVLPSPALRTHKLWIGFGAFCTIKPFPSSGSTKHLRKGTIEPCKIITSRKKNKERLFTISPTTRTRKQTAAPCHAVHH